VANQAKGKKKDETVWMSCRARQGCEGNQAKVVFRRRLAIQQGGGTATRYRCMTCNGVFHIRH